MGQNKRFGGELGVVVHGQAQGISEGQQSAFKVHPTAMRRRVYTNRRENTTENAESRLFGAEKSVIASYCTLKAQQGPQGTP